MKIQQPPLRIFLSRLLWALPVFATASYQTLNSASCLASDPASAYKDALMRAQIKVLRERLQNMQALSTATVSTLHRPYKVGDSWDVLSWNWSDLTPSAGRGAILHYEITAVSQQVGTAAQQVLVTIVQQPSEQVANLIDKNVQSVQLTLQNLVYSSQRKIRLQDRSITLSGDTMPGNLSPLESYPFEFPDLRTAEKVNLSAEFVQEITPEALTVAKKAGFRLDPAQASRFESQDPFGRPINVVWQRGDLWPTYVSTPHGFMFLLKNAPSQTPGT